jgi:NADPH:quinone reductase-like Zn-dependent oxidoreductase
VGVNSHLIALAKAPLVLGGEGAAVVEEGGGSDFPVGSRVMFAGPYGVSENGAYGEWLAVRKEHICLIPETIDDVTAAGIPVAYLTAHMSLTLAGFQPGKTVLAPAIGGLVGNAVTQLARALDAKHAISSTTNPSKAEQAKALGFDEVIDLTAKNPDLGDLIAAESEYRRAGIFYPLCRSRDAEKLTAMRSTVRQTSERLVSLGDHVCRPIAARRGCLVRAANA